MEQAPTNLQTALNYVFAALCAVIVWNVTTTINEISGIREAINKTNAEISAIRIQISGDYITRAEYERKHEVIFK